VNGVSVRGNVRVLHGSDYAQRGGGGGGGGRGHLPRVRRARERQGVGAGVNEGGGDDDDVFLVVRIIRAGNLYLANDDNGALFGADADSTDWFSERNGNDE
jgi:hypothetical protein